MLDHMATTQGLHKWSCHLFETFGWMLLAKNKGYDAKIVAYKESLAHLQTSLQNKIKKVKDTDTKDDLKILLENVMILKQTVSKVL